MALETHRGLTRIGNSSPGHARRRARWHAPVPTRDHHERDPRTKAALRARTVLGLGQDGTAACQDTSELRQRMLVRVEGVVLRRGLEPQVAQAPQDLRPIVGPVVRHVEEDFPEEQVLVLALCSRLLAERVIRHPVEELTHPPLHVIPALSDVGARGRRHRRAGRGVLWPGIVPEPREPAPSTASRCMSWWRTDPSE